MSYRIAISAARAARASSSSPVATINIRTAPSAISTASHNVSPHRPSSSSAAITGGYHCKNDGSTFYSSCLSSSRLLSCCSATSIRSSRWRPSQQPQHHHSRKLSSTRRTIGSTPRILDDASADPKVAVEDEADTSSDKARTKTEDKPKTDGQAESKEATADDKDDDPCPPWQNPLHHNNPDYQKVLAEDFAPGEEMPVVPLPPFEGDDDDDGKVLAPPHIHALADQVVSLNMLEVAELVQRIGDHFGFDEDDGYVDGGDGDGDGGGGAEEEAKVEEKTAFEVKLMGFDAKSKIKVIKEVRGVTSLGLKEAKELVEGAPVSSCCFCFCVGGQMFV